MTEMYLKRSICSHDAKPPDFGAAPRLFDPPAAPHRSTNNPARRKHLNPPVGMPGIHVKNDSQQGTCTASSVPPLRGTAVFLGDAPNTPARSVAP